MRLIRKLNWNRIASVRKEPAVHPTRNDLSAKTRTRVVELLNARLADAIDLQMQAKQAHWNVKGPNFIALHELFDKIAMDLGGHIDDMAERITALGGTAEGTVQAVIGRSQLDPYPLGLAEGRAHLEALAIALARFGKGVRKAIDESGKTGDADTSDLFTGVSRDVDKSLWLVEAHLQADR
jgi:starvation-inducible DNA-binding protein